MNIKDYNMQNKITKELERLEVEKARLEKNVHKAEIRVLEKRLIMHLPFAVICVNKEGMLIYANRTFCEALGYEEEFLMGKPFMDFLYEEDYHTTIEVFQNAQKGIDYDIFENRYKCKDGSLVNLRWLGNEMTLENITMGIAKVMK